MPEISTPGEAIVESRAMIKSIISLQVHMIVIPQYAALGIVLAALVTLHTTHIFQIMFSSTM